MIKFNEKAPYAPVEYSYDVEEILFKGKSKFQEIMVIRNPFYGKMLTHIAMYAHPNPKKVIVIGGGDGGVVREVLKHKSVEKIYFVEIDEEVINVSKRFFPSVSSGIDDPKVEIKIMDGADFVVNRKSPDIDAVIIDSTDIIGFARSLFTTDFFTSGDGMFVTHSESLHFHKDMVIEIQEVLGKVFPMVDLYTAAIATYPGNWWTFAVASKGISPRETRHLFDINTKFYSDEIHGQSFVPKGFYKKLMNRELEW
jgi:spermidine synthase